MSTNAKGRRQQNQSELSSDAPQKNDNEEQQAKITNVGREIMRSILHQIISAAAHLHEKGIVHRDIKPSK
jgi:serine/threonine protein kinase